MTKTLSNAPATDEKSPHQLKLQLLDKALKKCQYQQDALIEVLHTAQETFGHLDDEILDYVSIQLKLPPSWVYGVATFYNFFSLEAQGDHVCVVCMGTACYVKGAGDILARIEQEFDLRAGTTTADNSLTLVSARCLGNCSLAPMLTLDGGVLSKQTPESTVVAIRKKSNTSSVASEETP